MNKITVYALFDDMPHSEQFAFNELFPEMSDSWHDVRWFITGFNNMEEVKRLVINLDGNPDTDVIATIDETTKDRDPMFVYGYVPYDN